MEKDLPMIQAFFSEDGEIIIGTVKVNGTLYLYKEEGKSAFIKLDHDTAIKLGTDLIAIGTMKKWIGKEGLDIMRTYTNTKGKENE